jgi:hypothetical protein
MRQIEYNKRGATIEALIVAQFEAVSGNPDDMNKLVEIRKQVKLDIPRS